MNRWPPWLLACLLLSASVASAVGGERTFAVRDTLRVEALADEDDHAAAALRAIAYEPREFHVTLRPTPEETYDALVTFPSPKPSGSDARDTVRLRWYAAGSDTGGVATAPAILIVHGLDPTLEAAQATARGLRARGVHAIIIELPGFGGRAADAFVFPGVPALEHAAQGLADIRRARDVVASLPRVTGPHVAIEGTSLGGFAAAGAASLDGAFDPVLLMNTGGDALGTIDRGGKDAAVLREALASAGYRGERLRGLVEPLEPTRLAHRLNPGRTWLWYAVDDRVVPPAAAGALAHAADLPADHVVRLEGNHYTSMLLLPAVLDEMVAVVRGEREGPTGEER